MSNRFPTQATILMPSCARIRRSQDPASIAHPQVRLSESVTTAALTNLDQRNSIQRRIVLVLAAAQIFGGVGVASGLRMLMSAFGFEMPNGPMVVSSQAVIVSFAVGVVITVLSAWLPARRAAKIAPIDGLREVIVVLDACSMLRGLSVWMISWA